MNYGSSQGVFSCRCGAVAKTKAPVSSCDDAKLKAIVGVGKRDGTVRTVSFRGSFNIFSDYD